MIPRSDDPDEKGEKPRRQLTKRQQTVLQDFVDILMQTDAKADEISIGLGSKPKFEDDGDMPTVDEKHQVAGAEVFRKFNKRMHNLDKELRNFANASRQLGSSIGLLSSASILRKRLAQVLYLFHCNASDLFPRKVQKREPTVVDAGISKMRRYRQRLSYKNQHLMQQPVIDDTLDAEDFPRELEALSKDIGEFLDCLNEFPEFQDEAIHLSIEAFQGDLKYWANCLEEYNGQFKYPAVQRYIHDLAAEMGEHIDNITATLKVFIEIGVPTIRFAQKHGTHNLLNLSTVATFFSAVTATTLQYSFEGFDDSQAPIAVIACNVFWFSSLVFSIAAAVNSLLGLTWKQAMYRSPFNRTPWWVMIWIKRSPLVFLVMSVACFSIGLCCFSYASNQEPITSIVTSVLTAITSFGLLAVSTWFASERWVYLRHGGQRWLADILEDVATHLSTNPAVKATHRGLNHIATATIWVGQRLMTLSSCWRRHVDFGSDTTDDVESAPGGSSAILPTVASNGIDAPSPQTSPSKAGASYRSRRPSDGDHGTVIFGSEPKQSFEVGFSPPGSPILGAPPNSPIIPPSRGKQLWRNALNVVKVHASMIQTTRPTPMRKRTRSSNFSSSRTEKSRTATEDLGPKFTTSRVGRMIKKLDVLESTGDYSVHTALVRHLQFSPNGRYLATSSWDRTSRILAVDDEFRDHRVLAHAKGFVGQVAWSQDGELLLTRLLRGVKVWTKDGVCKRTIDRKRAVHSVTWFPGGKEFLSVERDSVVKLDLSGKIIDEYQFERMHLHDVAVTIDSERLLCVGALVESAKQLRPSKSRPENRLIVYNMATKSCENQVPVINDVRDITLSKSGEWALVSYENKAPPQLWKLELLKDRDTNQLAGRLTLRHSYMPETSVDFAGPSYFGGKDDSLVLCAAKSGDIHFWDTESGSLLRHIRSQALGGELTCIAWNHALEDPYMFATGCHDGTVRIWTKSSPGDVSADGISPDFSSPSPSNGFDSNPISRTESPVAFQPRPLHDSPIPEHRESFLDEGDPPLKDSPRPRMHPPLAGDVPEQEKGGQ